MTDLRRPPHLTDTLVDRYVEQDLSDFERIEADRHLEACSVCRDEVAGYRVLVHELAALPMPEPPPGFALRILDAVRPSENALLLRFVSRAYAAAAVVVAAVASGILGTTGPGPVAGAVASGFSRTITEGCSSLKTMLVASVDLLEAMLELAPLTRAAGSLVNGLETAALSLAPEVHALIAMTLLLAGLVLVWAMSAARERGVPHVSLL